MTGEPEENRVYRVHHSVLPQIETGTEAWGCLGWTLAEHFFQLLESEISPLVPLAHWALLFSHAGSSGVFVKYTFTAVSSPVW